VVAGDELSAEDPQRLGAAPRGPADG
jgi:hypothetical protein